MTSENPPAATVGAPMDRVFLDDYAALHDGVGVVDVSDRAEVTIAGSDAQKLLHNLSTNEFKKLTPGQGCEAFVLDVKGKIIGHVFASLGENLVTLDSSPEQGPRLAAHFDRYIIREDAQPTDRTAERAKFLIAGPQAADALSRAVSVELPLEAYSHRPVDEAATAWVRRLPWPGAGAWMLVVPRQQGPAWLEKLVAAGARKCGQAAWETVRVESGLPTYSVDLSEENLAQEVDRNNIAISLNKGCYLGQETVARIDALGHVNKLLRGVKFVAGAPVPAGTELRKGEKVVGKTTSSVWSPRYGVIAMAFVRREVAAAGSELDSAQGPATTALFPLK